MDGGRKLENLERSYKDLELSQNLNQQPGNRVISFELFPGAATKSHANMIVDSLNSQQFPFPTI